MTGSKGSTAWWDQHVFQSCASPGPRPALLAISCVILGHHLDFIFGRRMMLPALAFWGHGGIVPSHELLIKKNSELFKFSKTFAFLRIWRHIKIYLNRLSMITYEKKFHCVLRKHTVLFTLFPAATIDKKLGVRKIQWKTSSYQYPNDLGSSHALSSLYQKRLSQRK